MKVVVSKLDRVNYSWHLCNNDYIYYHESVITVHSNLVMLNIVFIETHYYLDEMKQIHMTLAYVTYC